LIEENQPTQHEGGDTEKELSVEEPMAEMREGSRYKDAFWRYNEGIKCGEVIVT
jgi:hypothetical protein